MMTSTEIRKRFLNFFKERGHAILPSASLVTVDTPGATDATLFNTAGMQPLVPYLMGQTHPEGTRLASSQKCVRTGDLDEVGDKTHLTFFEMLGNWSLGDYFKEEAITYSWEFLTNPDTGLGLDPSRLYVTVFSGNDLVPQDDEAVEVWKRFVPEHRIYYKNSKSNWWTAGADSPAGPSTEMFYDLVGTLGDMTQEEFDQADEEQKVIEIWNDVFMAYRQEGGEIVGELPKKNVDTGAGLERITAVVQGVDNLFETDLFVPLMSVIKSHSTNYQERHARILADHIKTSVFMLQDGVVISNTGRGYVLRRILRRAYHSLEELGMSEQYIPELVRVVVAMYGDYYFASVDERLLALKIKVIATEVDKIVALIKKGDQLFKKFKESGKTSIDGALLSELRQTHGLPLSVAQKLAQRHGITISEEAIVVFQQLLQTHQELSRSSAHGKFKGGLAEDTPKIRTLHTATHLMLAGLRKYLGTDIHQKGSNITDERTRFDVSCPDKISREILDKVEAFVNEAIATNARVTIEMMDKKAAQQDSTITASFWERYPDTVKIYQITDSEGTIYSRELCGGPHVEQLSEIAHFGTFKITKEESVSAGVRRLKAVLE